MHACIANGLKQATSQRIDANPGCSACMPQRTCVMTTCQTACIMQLLAFLTLSRLLVGWLIEGLLVVNVVGQPCFIGHKEPGPHSLEAGTHKLGIQARSKMINRAKSGVLSPH